jgi:NTE family protein
MNDIVRRAFLIILFGCMSIFPLSSILQAQDESPAHKSSARPKIGLVLSGGGARGAAHVGIIQVLEELRVPVDYIAGTSMGSIIGGLYATGTPIDELEKLTTRIDWEEIFSDTVPRRHQFYREKSGKENYLIDIEIATREGLVIPKGLISGKKLDLTLRALTLGAHNDFNEFSIPFRAVATDVETGEEVVLDKGDLAKALRASMAIPVAFSPMEIDGRLLADGGMARNLPVDVARQMGADVVIAVNIGTPLGTRDELDNFLAITNQTIGFLTNRNVDEQIKALMPYDILITPDLKDITTGSFTRMYQAVEIGRKAAQDTAQELSRYSLTKEEYLSFRQQQLKRSTRPGKIEFIEIRKTEVLSAHILSGYLKRIMERARGKPPEAEVLARDIFEISQRADLENIDFQLVEQDGKQGLILEPREKEHVQHAIEVGLQLSNDFEGNTSYDILVKYTLTRINRLGAEWKNTFQLGERRKIFTEFFQPLETSGWGLFVAPYMEYNANPFYFYVNDERIAEYERRDLFGGADLGVQLAEYGELRVGLLKGRTKVKLSTGEPTLPENTFRVGAYKVSFVFDQLDDLGFPKEGMLLQTTYMAGREPFGSDEDYDVLKAQFAKPISIGRSTFIPRFRWESVLSSTDEFNQNFFLGGLFDLSGTAPNQLYGQQILLGELIYTFRLLKKKVFGNDLYAGASIEAGNAWEKRSQVSTGDLIYAGSAFLGADSIIGPIYLGFGHADEGNNAAYFYIGAFF